jgi:hypothetical protein
MGSWPGSHRMSAPSLDLISESRQVYGLLRKAYAEVK